ncbi:hypothetical protein JZ751_001314, partial [Albula glossodonta]
MLQPLLASRGERTTISLSWLASRDCSDFKERPLNSILFRELESGTRRGPMRLTKLPEFARDNSFMTVTAAGSCIAHYNHDLDYRWLDQYEHRPGSEMRIGLSQTLFHYSQGESRPVPDACHQPATCHPPLASCPSIGPLGRGAGTNAKVCQGKSRPALRELRGSQLGRTVLGSQRQRQRRGPGFCACGC